MNEWSRAFHDWRRWLIAAGMPKTTVSMRLYHVGRLAEAFADPWAVTTADMLDWLAGKDWAPNTRRAYRGSLRAFYKWAVAAGHLEHSPAAALPPVKVPRAKPRPAPDEAIAWALRLADERTALAIRLAAHCGLRRAEIAQARTEDLEPDLVGWSLRVVGKGGHVRLVPVTEEIAVKIRQAPPGYLFPSPAGGHLTPHHLAKLISRHLPAGYTTHSLRHTAGTKAYQGTKDLRAVQEFLGHSKPETTALYTQVSDEAVRAAMLAAAA